MRPLRMLVPAAAAMALVLAGLGSWVRINNSGLRCPEWPLCRGTSLADLSGGAQLEMAHRAAAGLEGLILLAIVAVGWPLRGKVPGLAPAIAAAAGLFILETALGAALVFTAGSPLSVTAHWACALCVLAALLALGIVIEQTPGRRPAAAGVRRQLAIAAAVAFVAMCLGSLVASLSPGMDGGAAAAVEMLQRLVAGSFIVVATLAATAALQRGPERAKNSVRIALALALCQAALGIAVIRLGLPPALKEAHAALAAVTFVVFVAATAFAAGAEPA